MRFHDCGDPVLYTVLPPIVPNSGVNAVVCDVLWWFVLQPYPQAAGVGLEGARQRMTTHDQVFRALSEAVHVVPPCERLNTRLMPITQQPTDVMHYLHCC